MKKIPRIRIGNDVPRVWPITTNGEEASLEGRDLKVVCLDALGRETPISWTAEGNEIHFTLYGRDQVSTGLYVMRCIENDGKAGMATVDSCFIELVAHTWEEDDPEGGGVLAGGEVHQSITAGELLAIRQLLESGVVTDDELAMLLELKVDKEAGKTLSSNDYTSAEKEKLAGIESIPILEIDELLDF